VSDSHHLDRRDFVKVVMTFLGTVMGAVIGIPAIGYLVSPATKQQSSDAWIPAGNLESYEVGVPKLFSFTRSKVNGWEKTVNSYGAYVIKQSATEALVLSNMCTHLSCRVTWHDAENKYICPCHDGHFDKEGLVTYGPAPKPLNRYETKVEDGVLYLHLVEG
jgi:menaquinol-cytochrome c reductase iron-sulfur subunit